MEAEIEHIETALQKVIASIFNTSINYWNPATGGSLAETYIVHLDASPGTVVCKFGGANLWTGEVIEPAVYRLLLQETTLPLPAIHASGTIQPAPVGMRHDPQNLCTSWAVYSYLDALDGHSRYPGKHESSRTQLVAEAGRYLGYLHNWSLSSQFSHTGGLTNDPTSPHGVTQHRMNHPFIPHVLDRIIGTSALTSPVFCHGDYQPSNMLVTADGTIEGIIDWGNAHIAPVGYAVARAEIRFIDQFRSLDSAERTQLQTVFRSDYRENFQLTDRYERYSSVYKAIWCLQTGVNLTYVATTQRGRTQLLRQVLTLLDSGFPG